MKSYKHINDWLTMVPVFAMTAFLIYGSSAQAQSADSFLNTVKGLLKDPRVNSLLVSKASALLTNRKPVTNGDYYSGDLNAFASGSGSLNQPLSRDYQFGRSFAPPPSGFYSMQEGAPLGGIGYSTTGLNGLVSSLVPRGASPPANNAFDDAQMTISKKLAPAELQQLSRYDISVLVDRSGSMNTRDCPDVFGLGRDISRWQWCRDESNMLARQTAGALPAGITILPFSSKWTRYDNVSPQSLNSVFRNNSPDGSTNLAGALKSELDRYFSDRDNGLRQRPLMIAVITDGVPDSKSAVKRVIADAEQRMQRQGEIRICFFLIGDDQDGEDFVDGLVDDFGTSRNAVVPIKRYSFAEVNRVGLPRSLAFSLRN